MPCALFLPLFQGQLVKGDTRFRPAAAFMTETLCNTLVYSSFFREATLLSLVETPHLGLQMPHLKPDLPQMSLQMPHIGLKMPHLRPCLPQMKPQMPHLGPETSHMKPYPPHIGLQTSQIKPRISPLWPDLLALFLQTPQIRPRQANCLNYRTEPAEGARQLFSQSAAMRNKR
jgi:hypothetical protein